MLSSNILSKKFHLNHNWLSYLFPLTKLKENWSFKKTAVIACDKSDKRHWIDISWFPRQSSSPRNSPELKQHSITWNFIEHDFSPATRNHVVWGFDCILIVLNISQCQSNTLVLVFYEKNPFLLDRKKKRIIF